MSLTASAKLQLWSCMLLLPGCAGDAFAGSLRDSMEEANDGRGPVTATATETGSPNTEPGSADAGENPVCQRCDGRETDGATDAGAIDGGAQQDATALDDGCADCEASDPLEQEGGAGVATSCKRRADGQGGFSTPYPVGTRTCSNVDNAPYGGVFECKDDGYFHLIEVCEYLCEDDTMGDPGWDLASECVGECHPGDVRCAGGVLERCGVDRFYQPSADGC